MNFGATFSLLLSCYRYSLGNLLLAHARTRYMSVPKNRWLDWSLFILHTSKESPVCQLLPACANFLFCILHLWQWGCSESGQKPTPWGPLVHSCQVPLRSQLWTTKLLKRNVCKLIWTNTETVAVWCQYVFCKSNITCRLQLVPSCSTIT